MKLNIEVDNLADEIANTVADKVMGMFLNQNQKDYFTTLEVREYAGGISNGTLAKWRKDGLKWIVIDGLRFYKREDVIEFMDAHRDT